MARTALTKQSLTGPYPSSLNMDTITFAAADVANMNSFVFTGNEVVIAVNTGASPRNITLTSIADDRGRVGNVTQVIAAGAYAVYQATQLAGWLQSDGSFYLQADHADVEFAIVKLA